MKIKIIAILITTLMLLGSYGAIGSTISLDKNNETDEVVLGAQSVISGYMVDDPSKVGTVGEYTSFLAENKDLGVEIMERRTATARHFRNDDGTITAYLSLESNCYKDKNGIWHDGEKPIQAGSGFTTLDEKEITGNYYGYVEYFIWDNANPLDPKSDHLRRCFVYKESESTRYTLPIGQHYRKDWTGYFWRQYFRGFAQWNIDSIPDETTRVTGVELSFLVSDETKHTFHDDPFNGLSLIHI